jgi:hypothetical protein
MTSTPLRAVRGRLRLAVAGAAAPTPLGAPGGVLVPGASLAFGPMGSNEPEPGRGVTR